ncbi:P-loop containing nucleoside triphosphate hydrolase protein [Morchella snyderi]|nr:P-loop containing nucleoside triphosphate hydrolase protein [Morchella snyderi]
MSRHKNIRNLDLDEELYDYDGEDHDDGSGGMSESDRYQLNVGLQKVREVLGNEVATDKEIRESLWYYFFDVEKTVNYILNQHGKPTKKKKSKSSKGAPTSAFSGPSPDDVVVAAQSSSKGLNGKAASKNDPKALADAKALKKVEAAIQAVNIDSAPVKQRKKIDVLQEYKNSTAKENANFVVIGHVDAGKSTLMGRLLLDTGVVDQRTVEKFKQEAEKIGKSSFALAWVLDQTDEERSRGVTMDIAVNKFETEKARFTILDAPGHRDFIPNMIAGASQADFAVLVIDSSTGAFEAGFHLRGQTKEHTLLVRSMGVQRIIVAVNKLDSVEWSHERFEEIEQQMTQFLTQARFASKNISFIPCSGLTGGNVVKKPKPGLIPWYFGPTLVEELEKTKPLTRAIEKPLRITISDVFKGGITNPVSVSGRIEAGSLQVGDNIVAIPSGEGGVIKAIEVDDEPTDWAVAGHNVVIHLSNIDMVHLREGDILCDPTNRVTPQSSFTIKILAFEGLTPMMVDVHRGRLHAPGKVVYLLSTLDKATGVVLKKRPRHITAGSLATVKVELMGNPIPLEAGYKVVLRSGGQTVAAGIVEQ